jgi:histidyl-tRNA synthetase
LSGLRPLNTPFFGTSTSNCVSPTVYCMHGSISSEEGQAIMKNLIPSIKGTRDFYPQEMAVRDFLYATMRRVSESFGYQEYDGPFLESIDLYAAKSGEELVKEQSFVFPDRGGDLITLRPELTPTLVRMVAQRQKELVFPLRWWSWGPFWRYERPQKGRTREFFQWNVDIIGAVSPEADAELAAVMATFFKEVGLQPDEVKVLVNNRRLMEAELDQMGVSSDLHTAVFRLIDRRDKLSPADWEAYALETGLTAYQLKDLKNLLADNELWRSSDELVRFFRAVEALGVSDYVIFAPHIIRGLDYYTGTVYEAQEQKGDIRRAILGGGRYDNLMADVGGDPLPGVGFAMGDLVITLILEKLGRLPEARGDSPASVLVTVFDDQHILDSFQVAAELRRAGLKIAVSPTATKLPKQFKYADRMGAKVVVVIGPDEAIRGQLTIKDLRHGTQQTLPRPAAAAAIRQLLESNPGS